MSHAREWAECAECQNEREHAKRWEVQELMDDVHLLKRALVRVHGIMRDIAEPDGNCVDVGGTCSAHEHAIVSFGMCIYGVVAHANATAHKALVSQP